MGDEIDHMANDLDWLLETWAHKTPGWSGPWRKDYMDEETEKQSKLIAMHDLYFYSESWMKAVTNLGLCHPFSGPELSFITVPCTSNHQRLAIPFPCAKT